MTPNEEGLVAYLLVEIRRQVEIASAHVPSGHRLIPYGPLPWYAKSEQSEVQIAVLARLREEYCDVRVFEECEEKYIAFRRKP